MNQSILKCKKLLILAGADVHVKLVQAAKAIGVYTIVTDYLPKELSPAKQIADEYWMYDIKDTDAIVAECRKAGVDGVLAYCIDPSQLPYQEICEKLNVPCYGTKEQFTIMTDKRLFKDFCKAHGVGIIPEYSLEDIEHGKVDYPILIKPTISRGSRGQTICYSKKDVPAAIDLAERESQDGHIVIERYMMNTQDMALAYFVRGGVPYLVKIGDRYVGDIKDQLDRQQMATIVPSRHTEEYMRCVHPQVAKMIQALGLTFGAVFLQAFYKDGQIFMYDPGLRFPGSDFDVVLKAATGLDLMTSFVQFALTDDRNSCVGKVERAYDYNGGACVILSISVRAGKIARYVGYEKIATLPYVFSSCQRLPLGTVVEATGDVRQRALEFCAFIEDRTQVKAFFDLVYDTVDVLDEKGESMIISKVKL